MIAKNPITKWVFINAFLAKTSAVERCCVLSGRAKGVESNNCIVVHDSRSCVDQGSLAVQW